MQEALGLLRNQMQAQTETTGTLLEQHGIRKELVADFVLGPRPDPTQP